ncbi:Pyruvate/Phosphoenolpyruvate kinase-like domain-containing protein [Rhodocollybia butyracea]|uniref:Pyruvate/Phosphoenolpyruvate kinase-like domain-containing protein n=1 Tax=Rhodocollybia butyracea TaxID=206335 RepID=A0A9P5PCN5_9AGAR|nr:Pyruvate/Phosphoenolpyruvate kinase-like domain-containing protein [Rhodocollybia butyracea]
MAFNLTSKSPTHYLRLSSSYHKICTLYSTRTQKHSHNGGNRNIHSTVRPVEQEFADPTLNSAQSANAADNLRRSYLYVPASSDKLLQKSLSLTVNPDVIIYDLEDSVPPTKDDKGNARTRLMSFLEAHKPQSEITVRVNDVSSPFFEEDMVQIVKSPSIHKLILPKIHSVEDLETVGRALWTNSTSGTDIRTRMDIIPSVESARALWNLGSIADWKYNDGRVRITGLLFAAEDYCADTSILRTRTRRELLYTRSRIAIAAKAFGLESIDMVCTHYKDLAYLKEECEDGRALGFSGKQAIHPSQVEMIQNTFVPSAEEILHAAKILSSMKSAHASAKGAIGLEGEMIDAPMIKQASKIIEIAEKAGLDIPNV